MNDNVNLKISVIVPVFNAELYLDKCLDSIVNQEYVNLEIIIIDDGSTDNSYSICEKYSVKDKRIILWHQDNMGLVYTRKVGLKMASGDYISFVDADDYIDSDMFSKLICKERSTLPDIMAFGLEEVYSDHVVRKKNSFKQGFYSREKIENDIFPSMLSRAPFFSFGILPNLVCKLIKRTFINNCNICVSDIITVGEDADVTFQLMANAQTIEIVDFYPYHYCKRDGSMMWKELRLDSIDALEDDLRSCFFNVGLYDAFKNQLKEYITFVKLLKNPISVSDVDKVFSNSNNRIALYGAGGFGQSLYNRYKSNVSIWSDKNNKFYSEKGLPVISVEEMISKQEQFDIVYVAILDTKLCEQIRVSLIEKGVKKKITYFHI